MKYNFEDIKDQVVLVTGSGRGIGRATAELFASMGARVVISDMDEEVCNQAATEISQKTGSETMHVVCNITNREQVDAMFQAIVDKWGQIDCVINNAGITKDGLFLRMKPEQWNFIIDVNLTGTYQVSHAAVQHMRKKKSGTIINMSSIARGGNPGQVNYSAAKAGIVGFTAALAKEIAPMGIRVNCIAPGFIDTRLTDAIPDKMAEQMVAAIPMKRKGQPEDIARVCLFLASELSGYVTGQVIDVNGGLGGL
ncbi:MAG: 3-oxoacyl-ACP reductase FabG [Leptospiraceae bacterium]|nr:3-oxoacyl-ACP reductase FabG [Leptospiraceae bacterium]